MLRFHAPTHDLAANYHKRLESNTLLYHSLPNSIITDPFVKFGQYVSSVFGRGPWRSVC